MYMCDCVCTCMLPCMQVEACLDPMPSQRPEAKSLRAVDTWPWPPALPPAYADASSAVPPVVSAASQTTGTSSQHMPL